MKPLTDEQRDLAAAHAKRVYLVAHRAQSHQQGWDDDESDAALALCRAAAHWANRAAFWTYASKWIDGALTRARNKRRRERVEPLPSGILDHRDYVSAVDARRGGAVPIAVRPPDAAAAADS